jgi:hypothetical protein
MTTRALRGARGRIFVVTAVLLILSPPVWAQTASSGNIAGVVRDPSGAVLPGVTVEASSPALIEKVRVAVTDGSGQYRVVELRPGIYTVTFTLTGFNTLKREGIQLTTGFTANVDAEMTVGSLEETVQVTGASPVVDTQNVRSQAVLSHEYLEAVPTGKASAGFASLILGATSGLGPDVGGSKGENSSAMAIHGSRVGDYRQMVDGMIYSYAAGGGTARGYYVNHAGTQETVLETSGMSAETEAGGIQQNAVPKDGGNRFVGVFEGDYAGPSLEVDNLTKALRDRGVVSSNSVRPIYDILGGLGGPIKRDKLWFYTAHRYSSTGENFAGNYFNKRELQNTVIYQPDLSRPAYLQLHARDNSLRVTWQATQKDKWTFFEGFQDNFQGFFEITGNTANLPLVAPEATGHVRFFPVSLTQVTWTRPASSRLLLQAGATYGHSTWERVPIAGNTADAISIFEQSTGFTYGARSTYIKNYPQQANARASVSYITGSHAFKTGVFFFGTPPWGDVSTSYANHDINYTFRKPTPDALPVPVSVTLLDTPEYFKEFRRDLAVYAEDQWTAKRLTLNLGVRLDTWKEWAPAQTKPAGTYVGAISFPAVNNLANFKDVDPRLGAAYNLFGDGKTALKVAAGRYPLLTSPGSSAAPENSIVRSAIRLWNDADHDYMPQESELAGLSNTAFGTVVPNTTFDNNVLHGWGNRQHSWQTSAAVQHEFPRGLGFEIAYFRTSYYNFQVTNNLKVTPTDYSPYCVQAPVDSRLPNGGGYQICGLYDINPRAFGPTQNQTSLSSKFGKQTETHNGVEINFNARFGQGGFINGGSYLSKTVTDNCFVVNSPQQLYQCHVSTPLKQFKFNGSYPLPWDLQAAWVYQNLQGTPISANLTYTNAQIAPSLGRNLGACGAQAICNATATVSLIQPGTMFENRYTQLDLRLTKIIHMGGARLQVMLDAYNVLNTIAFIGRNNTFGTTSWGQPNGLQLGRLFKFGTQMEW